MSTEVEARFRADGAQALDELATRTSLADATLGPAVTVTEVDRYLDTTDGRLADARWACRLRAREGATRLSMKGPAGAQLEPWLHRRPELEGPATDEIDPAAWPPSPAHDLLDRLRAGGDLHERLRFDQERTERSVELRTRLRIGTLSLDRVRMSSADAHLGELFIVELELDQPGGSAESELPRLASALAAIDGLEAEPASKLERALERFEGAR
ncbi:MAG: CYTH domain-containing protein [Candidatus Limnocylindria bacterium]